jgi:hypothetical protein
MSVTEKELREQIAQLEKEKNYYETLANIKMVPALDMWGRERGPITDAERARFKAKNEKIRLGRDGPITEADMVLGLTAKVIRMREQASKKK